MDRPLKQSKLLFINIVINATFAERVSVAVARLLAVHGGSRVPELGPREARGSWAGPGDRGAAKGCMTACMRGSSVD